LARSGRSSFLETQAAATSFERKARYCSGNSGSVAMETSVIAGNADSAALRSASIASQLHRRSSARSAQRFDAVVGEGLCEAEMTMPASARQQRVK
jgi:hypothetical protein